MPMPPMRFATLCLSAGLGLQMPAIAISPPVNPDRPPASPPIISAELVRAQPRLAVVRLDQDALRYATQNQRTIVIDHFPLPGSRQATLRLERFSPVMPDARFVIGHPDNPDRRIPFDASGITMLRGTIDGIPNSSVFISLAPRSATGRFDLGPGRERFLLSSFGGSTTDLAPGEYAVFPASQEGGVGLEVPMCAVTPPAGLTAPIAPGSGTPPPPPPPPTRDADPIRGLRQIELAIDTDYELFELFGNADDTLTYIIQLYGQVSDIYIRDVNTRFDLTYIRIWDNPNDLYHNNEDPLNAFRDHWEANMQAIHRDVAQLLLGSRRLSAGGVAYAPALCNSSSYSWSGYTLGYFADPDRPHWSNRDIMVTAHELGHNCGTFHTHDYGLDNCDDALSQPQRGTIMAYCGQTYSGGDANHDLWFHELTAQKMREYVYSRPCVIADCNQNHKPDSEDISLGLSQDVNANGIPDECEDCNQNDTLDAVEIAAGTSADVNANGIPDECESDCNSNGVPDLHDILLSISHDLNANRIPDECEPDLDANEVADYLQITADMTLDVDRNLVLDSVQDCDGDGITDHAELNHAWNVYVATTSSDASVREFFSLTGVLVNVANSESLPDGQDLVITPSGRVLVSGGSQHRIAELNSAGQFVGNLATVPYPTGMLVLPQTGTLLVASRNTNSIQELSLTDGSLVRTVVAPGAGGLNSPFGLAIQGNRLCVSDVDGRVLEYNLSTGIFMRILVSAGSGSLSDPRGILFKPDGNLLVASRGSNRINEYNGQTGAFISKWNRNGTSSRLTLDEPWCLRLGPDGDVYVSRNRVTRDGHGHDHGGDHWHDVNLGDHRFGGTSALHLTDARVYQFDIRNGNMVRAYILGSDTGLYRPTGFDFMPDFGSDCNRNQIPDSCDIAGGVSADLNANGIPDECEPACAADFDHSGFVDTDDFDAFVHAFEDGGPDADVDGSGFVDLDDFSFFVLAFEAGC
ncbi:MAG: hypothetical protein IT435_02960 [Phycisphaerales bacterium]|nr:hypothetical protein [Phycisphaerales bacterium]